MVNAIQLNKSGISIKKRFLSVSEMNIVGRFLVSHKWLRARKEGCGVCILSFKPVLWLDPRGSYKAKSYFLTVFNKASLLDAETFSNYHRKNYK